MDSGEYLYHVGTVTREKSPRCLRYYGTRSTVLVKLVEVLSSDFLDPGPSRSMSYLDISIHGLV
jgi:hypothetical protein